MEWLLWVFVAFLLLYEPIWGYIDYKIFENKLKTSEQARLHYYRNTLIGLWVPTLFIFGLVAFSDLTLMDIGLGIPSIDLGLLGKSFSIIVLVLFGLYVALISYYLIAYYTSERFKTSYLEASAKQMEQLAYASLLPVTRKEKKMWTFVSFTAGFTEEIIYRSFLLYALTVLFPTVSIGISILLSSALFGLAHTYQGWTGVLRTGLIGTLFACVYLILGSIWPLIAFHFLIDYVAKLGEDEETTPQN